MIRIGLRLRYIEEEQKKWMADNNLTTEDLFEMRKDSFIRGDGAIMRVTITHMLTSLQLHLEAQDE